MLAVGPFDERRAPGSGVVSRSLTFDFDDVGAQIGEHLARPGAGQDAGKLENAEAGKRF